MFYLAENILFLDSKYIQKLNLFNRYKNIGLLGVIIFFITSSVFAENDDFFNAVEVKGFSPSKEKKNENKPAFNVGGELGYRIHYGFQDKLQSLNFDRKNKGIALSRLNLKLHTAWSNADGSIAIYGSVKGETNSYTNQPSKIKVDETYIELKPSETLKFKLGRQFAIFGESDYFQVTDIVNPIDQREFFLAELKETRLPILSSRLSYIRPSWGLDFILFHEFRTNDMDVSRGDFDPYIIIGGREQQYFRQEPNTDSDFAFRAFLPQSWGDVSIMLSNKHDYSPTAVDVTDGKLTLDYPKVKTIGLSANYVVGNWVLKTDYAYKDSKLTLNNKTQRTRKRNELMLGVRYSGISNTSVNLEVLKTRNKLRYKGTSTQDLTTEGILGITKTLQNNKLSLSLLLGQAFSGDSSRFVRLEQEYNINDAATVSAGYIYYDADDQDDRFYSVKKNSRTYMGMKYDF
jgi:hypothetical protein